MGVVKGMMGGVSVPALALGLCSIEGEGEDGAGGGGGGGGGGAADLLDDPAAVAAAAAGGGDGDAAAVAAAAAAADPEVDDGKPVDVPDFLKPFSPEKKDGKLSNQEYLAKRGFKDLDGVVVSLRETERALREGGRIKVPGEGASEADVTAFREAIGVPKEPAAYEVAVPAAPEFANFEVDTGFVDPLRKIAHEHNVSATAFKALAEGFMQNQATSMANEAAQLNTDRDTYFGELGAKADERKAEFRNGARVMGLDKIAIAKVQAGVGVAATIDMIANVGRLAGEDAVAGLGGGNATNFGVSSAAQAQRQLDALISDKAKELRAKDPAVTATYNRLVAAKAHYAAIESRPRR